jgi:chemotaxis protein MotB
MARKKKEECEEGAPKWMVTFSDMVTLLLTFFVLLLSFSTISENEFNEAMLSLKGAFGVLPKFQGVISYIPKRPTPATEEVANKARRLQRQLQVKGLDRQVRVEYDAVGGLKISLPNAMLFDAGSATLRPAAYPLLQDIAGVLGEMPDSFIEIRGHTDNSPTGTASVYRDNFELSYYRADSVARQMIDFGGVPGEQFEIVACGPNQPRATNLTEEGRRANRRVEIYVRGLVDKSKIESLAEGVEERGEAPPPITPQGYDALR